MSFTLPINQEGAYFGFSTELEGVTYSFSWRWNDRDGAWYLEIGDGSGVVLITGIKVVVDKFLLGGSNLEGLPSGDFIAIDTTGRELDAGFEDLGRRVQVHYFTRDELLAFVGG